jgi:hypothetical protein
MPRKDLAICSRLVVNLHPYRASSAQIYQHDGPHDRDEDRDRDRDRDCDHNYSREDWRRNKEDRRHARSLFLSRRDAV